MHRCRRSIGIRALRPSGKRTARAFPKYIIHFRVVGVRDAANIFRALNQALRAGDEGGREGGRVQRTF